MQKRKKISGYLIWMDTKLGQGTFAKVFLGQQDGTNRRVAIKMFDKITLQKNNSIKDEILSEVQILKSVRSPHIVEFLNVQQSNNFYYIIQQFCNGGELRKYMNKTLRIPQKEAISFLRQISMGLFVIVQQGIMHRDLKPENILINNGILKISDFGLSKKVFDRVSKQTHVGTPYYMSLELLMGNSYSSKCDIWSLGCIFYEMLHGKTPWTGNTEYDLIMNIHHKPLNISPQLSDTTKSFLKGCLALEQKDRFSWSQLFNHPIFQGKFQQFINTEDHFKILMTKLRSTIKVKNISLPSYFQNIGFHQNSHMDFYSFKNTIKYIDDHIVQEDVKYLYQKIACNPNIGISYTELENCFMKFGIPTSLIKTATSFQIGSQLPLNISRSQYLQPNQTTKINSQNSSQNKQSQSNSKQINSKSGTSTASSNNYSISKSQTTSKFENSLQKLSFILENKKMNIYALLQKYQLNSKGFLNSNDLGNLLKFVDPNYSNTQIQSSFNLMDINSKRIISINDFLKYYFSTIQKIEKKDSINSPSSANKLSYPPKYNRSNGIFDTVVDELEKIPHIFTNKSSTDSNSSTKKKSQGGSGWF